jgi:hypothetical protein
MPKQAIQRPKPCKDCIEETLWEAMKNLMTLYLGDHYEINEKKDSDGIQYDMNQISAIAPVNAKFLQVESNKQIKIGEYHVKTLFATLLQLGCLDALDWIVKISYIPNGPICLQLHQEEVGVIAPRLEEKDDDEITEDES